MLNLSVSKIYSKHIDSLKVIANLSNYKKFL